MNPEIDSPFEQFDKEVIIRRNLLPMWMKIFCWIFMVMGVLAIVCLIMGFLGLDAQLSFYGFETQKPLSAMGLFIIAIIVFKAFAAYSLWSQKDYAINIGKIDAIVGFGVCIASMFLLPFFLPYFNFTIRLETLLLIPYFLKLNKIEYAWVNKEMQ